MPILPEDNRFAEDVRSNNQLWVNEVHTLTGLPYVQDFDALRTQINSLNGGGNADTYFYEDPFVPGYYSPGGPVNGGKVSIPRGFLLEGTNMRDWVTGRDDTAEGLTDTQLQMNGVKLTDSGTTRPLGAAMRKYYQEVYSRTQNQTVTVVDKGIAVMPLFESTADNTARDTLHNAVKHVALGNWDNLTSASATETAHGDLVTWGTGTGSSNGVAGRFVSYYGSNSQGNSGDEAIGRVVGMEKVHPEEGITGWLGLDTSISPFELFRDQSWYVDPSTAEGIDIPQPYIDTFQEPRYDWWIRGRPGLDDGTNTSVDVSQQFDIPSNVDTASNGESLNDYVTKVDSDTLDIDITEFVYLWNEANINTDASSASVAVPSGADDPNSNGGDTKTIDSITESGDTDYGGQYVVRVSTNGADGWDQAGTLEITVEAYGQHPGLPVNLDQAGVVGTVYVDFDFS